MELLDMLVRLLLQVWAAHTVSTRMHKEVRQERDEVLPT